METTDAACHEAMQWVTHLHAQGSTSILHALLASSTTEPNPISQTEIPSPPIRTLHEAFKLQRALSDLISVTFLIFPTTQQERDSCSHIIDEDTVAQRG